jgi:hypothetical protein
MCTPLYTSIAREKKSQFMKKTKLCCFSCRCVLMLCYNNIQTVYDWSWWHSWNIEEIDDDSIHPHTSIRIHHTVVFYYLYKGGDYTFCLCMYIYILIFNLWACCWKMTIELFEKSEFLFSSSSLYKQYYYSFMTINVVLMSTEPFTISILLFLQ